MNQGGDQFEAGRCAERSWDAMLRDTGTVGRRFWQNPVWFAPGISLVRWADDESAEG